MPYVRLYISSRPQALPPTPSPPPLMYYTAFASPSTPHVHIYPHTSPTHPPPVHPAQVRAVVRPLPHLPGGRRPRSRPRHRRVRGRPEAALPLREVPAQAPQPASLSLRCYTRLSLTRSPPYTPMSTPAPAPMSPHPAMMHKLNTHGPALTPLPLRLAPLAHPPTDHPSLPLAPPSSLPLSLLGGGGAAGTAPRPTRWVPGPCCGWWRSGTRTGSTNGPILSRRATSSSTPATSPPARWVGAVTVCRDCVL